MKQVSISAVFLSLLFLAGCAANQTKTGIFQHLSDRDTVPLQMALESGEDVNQTDKNGRTLLHHALRSAPHLIPVIIKANPDVNVQDKNGMTPLHVSVMSNPAYIPALLLMGADASIQTISKFQCRSGQRHKLVVTATPVELAETCKRSEAIAAFNQFARDTEAWSNAKQQDDIAVYEAYLADIKKPLFAKEAHIAIKRLREQWMADMREKTLCEMQEPGWFFIKGTCKNNQAHGDGVAVTIDNEKFVGEFLHGWRLKGKYSKEGVIFYDGEYAEGIQHGYGVCRYQEKMEECRLYQGERIDTLFKQRENMQSEFQRLAGKMDQLRGAVAASNRPSSNGSNNRFSYIADLASDDDTTRTAAQVQAALDIFRVMIESAN